MYSPLAKQDMRYSDVNTLTENERPQNQGVCQKAIVQVVYFQDSTFLIKHIASSIKMAIRCLCCN
jgi:hypothetical protein